VLKIENQRKRGKVYRELLAQLSGETATSFRATVTLFRGPTPEGFSGSLLNELIAALSNVTGMVHTLIRDVARKCIELNDTKPFLWVEGRLGDDYEDEQVRANGVRFLISKGDISNANRIFDRILFPDIRSNLRAEYVQHGQKTGKDETGG